MDVEQTKGILESLPELLNRYSRQSFVLLAVLAAGAAVLLFIHFRARRAHRTGLPVSAQILAGVLAFLSVGGMVVRGVSLRSERLKREAALAEARARLQKFIATHRAAEGERRILISDFTLPGGGDDAQRRALSDRMRRQVPIISEILSEELPEDFAQPLVVSLPITGSPWEDGGIRQDNFQAVLQELHGFELLWGDVYPDGKRAKTFLGVPRELAGELDTVIPLKDVHFEDDPAAEYFREGRPRLLGQVMLAMALDSYRRGAATTGAGRKDLYLKAAAQLQKARQALSSFSSDPILRRNLFSQKVDLLFKPGLDAEGLQPQ